MVLFFSFLDILFLFLYKVFNVYSLIADISSIILPIVITCFFFLRKDIKTWALAIPVIIVYFVGGGLRILGVGEVFETIENRPKEKNFGDGNVFYIAFVNQIFLIVLFVFTCPLFGKKSNENNNLNQ